MQYRINDHNLQAFVNKIWPGSYASYIIKNKV